MREVFWTGILMIKMHNTIVHNIHTKEDLRKVKKQGMESSNRNCQRDKKPAT